MPHTTIEHSFIINKPNIDEFLLCVNQRIANSKGDFSIFECKARTILYDNFLVAENISVGILRQDFMHITIKIMSGRSLEIRQNLAKNLLKMTKTFIQNNNLSQNKISLSIDIVEMCRDIYQKTVINT
jgi:5-carboxymethyl-2-hydroxymuconate isomerase